MTEGVAKPEDHATSSKPCFLDVPAAAHRAVSIFFGLREGGGKAEHSTAGAVHRAGDDPV